jgi:hypothetical protein
VVERGVTIAGKPLWDHLGAADHHEALGYVRQLAERSARLGEADVGDLHRLVKRRSSPDIAGACARQGVTSLCRPEGRLLLHLPRCLR